MQIVIGFHWRSCLFTALLCKKGSTRSDAAATHERDKFNVVQIGMAVLTILAVGSLVLAISQRLLGHPDMNITGNRSDSSLLRWYQDVSDRTIPQAWVFSIPMLTYRGAMLAWAFWISFWLAGILKWGWQQFTSPKIWYSTPPKS
jgi:hypothetical protein